MSSTDALARRTVRGIGWAFVTTLAARVVSLVGLAILARLLAPADFGLFAFALLFITYAETVGDLGTGIALIQHHGPADDAAEVTFLFNLATGAAWFALTFALAPTVAAFFHNPAGAPVLRLMGAGFLLKAVGNTHDAICQRELRFRERLLPELGLTVVKAAVSVLLAWRGLGVWGLAWGHLAGLLAWTSLLWLVVPWRPRLRVPPGLARPMLAFGRRIVAVNLLAAVVHHADLVVVGRLLGPVALGFYQMAYKLPEMTVAVVIWMVSRVLFPAFSRLVEEGAELRGAFLTALRYVALLTLPAAAGMMLLAEPLVLALFGEQWRPAVPILRALAVYIGLRSLGTQAGDILKATGRPGWLAGLGAARAVVLLPLLVAAAPLGPAAVAWTLAGVTALSTAANLVLACRLADASARALWEALRPGAIAVALLAPALVLWNAAWPKGAATGALAGGLAVGAAVYLAVLRLLTPDVYRQAIQGLQVARSAHAPAAGEAR